jgi:hypothetical protein
LLLPIWWARVSMPVLEGCRGDRRSRRWNIVQCGRGLDRHLGKGIAGECTVWADGGRRWAKRTGDGRLRLWLCQRQLELKRRNVLQQSRPSRRSLVRGRRANLLRSSCKRHRWLHRHCLDRHRGWGGWRRGRGRLGR